MTIDADTITDEQIRESSACVQCRANASWNLRGGYKKAAVSCLEYCARGHKDAPFPSDDDIRAFRETCREFISESRLALHEVTSSPKQDEARARAERARARCAEILNARSAR